MEVRISAGPGGKGIVLVTLVCALAGTALSQSMPTVRLPKPDADGWIKIFRGDNLGDFSVFTTGGSPAAEGKPFGDPFYVQDGTMIRTDGNPGGQLIFKQNFSHYIMEVQLRWPGNVFNCGVMTKIQWNANGIGNGLPQCVEVQGDPKQGMGQVWTLGTPPTYITFRGKRDPTSTGRFIVDDTQPVTEHGGSYGCIVGYPGWQKPYPAAVAAHEWVTITAENHGKDTAKHFVDGQKVMQYWNPRAGTGTSAKTLVEGMVSVQSEGGEVWYRNWRIKLLPEDPLYASLYTPVVLKAPPGARKGRESFRLGFDGATLTILSGERAVSTLTGRRIEGPRPGGFLKP